MNEITRYLNRRSLDYVRDQHPVQTIYDFNPEIGSLVYAHMKEIFTPELMNFVTNIRHIQRDEFVAGIQEITKRAAIIADREKHQLSMETQRIIAQMQVSGQVQQTQLITDAEKHGYDTQLEGLRVQANAQERMVGTQVAGQNYQADKNLEGRLGKAREYRKSVEVRENAKNRRTQLMADAQKRLHDNKLKAEQARALAFENATKVREKGETDRTKHLADAQKRGYDTQLKIQERNAVAYERANQAEQDSLRDREAIRAKGQYEIVKEQVAGQNYQADKNLEGRLAEVSAVKEGQRQETERTRINAQTMLEIELAKNRYDNMVWEAIERKEIHISDNDYKAFCLQAEYTAESLKHSKEVELAIARGASEDRLRGLMRQLEVYHDLGIKRINTRYNVEKTKRIKEFERTKRSMFQSLCQSRALVAQAKEETKRQGYEAVQESIKAIAPIMLATGCDYIEAEVQASNGVYVHSRLRKWRKK